MKMYIIVVFIFIFVFLYLHVFLNFFQEGSGVKETIKRFKFYLLEETSTLDKQQLVDIASHFVKVLSDLCK